MAAQRRRNERAADRRRRRQLNSTASSEFLAALDRWRAERGEGATVEQLLHELDLSGEELTIQNQQLMQAQADLEHSRDRYADLYEFAPVAFLTLDRNGIVSELNLTAAAFLGQPRASIEGLPFMRYIRDEHRRDFLEFLRRCRNSNGSEHLQVSLSLVTANGDRHVEIVANPRVAEDSSEPRFLTAIVDLTERNRLENERRLAEEEGERLRHTEALAVASAEAKDEFLARLSHELRTPLTPVLAALTDPNLTRQAPAALRNALKMMRRDVELEVRLIDDLLDVTRISRHRLRIKHEAVDVHAAIEDVVSLLAHEATTRGIQIATKRQADASWVMGDATRLRQVLWNLSHNALKFTPRGGRVTIASTNSPEGALEVRVSDTGRGMDASTVARLFEGDDRRLVPLPPEAGLGLGLTICQGVVQAHGGTIRAASAGWNRGSTFTVVLPDAFDGEHDSRGRPASDAPGMGEAAPECDPSNVQILLVEDDEDTAAMMSALLGLHGYHVEVARSVDEAVRKSDEHRFDLLISDIRLPDGTGIDLMRRLGAVRARHAIAVSGFGSPEDARRSLEAGFDEHLVKPLDMTTVLDTIERHCGRSSSTAG
jgi:PAS domain S-box-containing protein